MADQIPMLGEHESPVQETTAPGEYSPDDTERKAIKLVNKLFEKAKKHREKYDEKWMDYYKMFRGKQWKEERPSYRHSAVFNLVFRVIQSQAPIQTDSRPKFEFLPQEPNDRMLAGILNEIAESDWESNNWLMQLAEIVYDANILGTGFSYNGFDEDANGGIGGACFESLDPFYCFPQPYTRDINHKDTEWFITAEPKRVSQLKAEYPDKAQHIKPDLTDFTDDEKTDIHRARFRSPNDINAIMEGSSDYSNKENDRALKITLWIKDDETQEEKKTSDPDPTTGAITEEYLSKKKYPKGRKIVIAGNVLLEDSENAYDDAKFPVSKLNNYMLPREFWGISEIEQIEGPQQTYNKIFSFVLDVLTLMGNPIWVIDSNAGIDTDNLYNRPGMVLEPTPGARVDRVEGTQLQPYVMQLLEKVGSSIDDIAGNNDISRGIKPEGVTAASAIKALQDTAQTRLRQKSRFLDAFLQDSGQQYLSRIFQFYTVPKVYRLTADNNVTKYFKFHVEDAQLQDGTVQKVAKYRQFVEQPDGSMAMGDEQQYQVQGKFDVRVGTGSSLPFAKSEKSSLAFELFDRKIIDAEEVLKTVDWPNMEAIVERLKAQAAEQMALQQQAQTSA